MVDTDQPEAKRGSKKGLLLGIVALLLVAAAYQLGLISVGPFTKMAADAKVDASNPQSKAPEPVPGSDSVIVGREQLRQITAQPVVRRRFRTEKFAIGQIAFNEDVTTPVFSPFTGRVVKLLTKLGDDVAAGNPLFEIDTPDVVQGQSDLINAAAALAKSKTQVELTQRAFNRQRDLFKAKAVAEKDFEQAQSDLRQAESDVRANEGVVIAARNKLRIVGKSEEAVDKVEKERSIDPIMRVNAPISGTITTRKVGPGQYVRVDNTDPLFSISDLSSMWLRANVAEADIPFVKVGQDVEVKVLAYPDETFTAKVTYIAASVDPTTHRVAVRSEIQNDKRLLKPEMFANFKIITNNGSESPSVPAGAVIRESDASYVWLAKSETEFERRAVKLGIESEGVIQILSDLPAAPRVVTNGAVFLDNARPNG